jgi:hypothetical protein
LPENAAKLRDALAPFIYVDRKAGWPLTIVDSSPGCIVVVPGRGRPVPLTPAPSHRPALNAEPSSIIPRVC